MANLKRIVSILFHLLGPFFIGEQAAVAASSLATSSDLRLPRENKPHQAKRVQAHLVA